MSKEIENHRLGAYIYGFLSGLGLVMVLWGIASIIVLPNASTASFGLTLLGVVFFAIGVCREAYLRGSLSDLSTRARVIRKAISPPQTQPTAKNTSPLIQEQLIEPPTVEAHKQPPEES